MFVSLGWICHLEKKHGKLYNYYRSVMQLQHNGSRIYDFLSLSQHFVVRYYVVTVFLLYGIVPVCTVVRVQRCAPLCTTQTENRISVCNLL